MLQRWEEEEERSSRAAEKHEIRERQRHAEECFAQHARERQAEEEASARRLKERVVRRHGTEDACGGPGQ